MIAIRHAWLQKHPSPAAGAGEFHWYPREGDREIRASCVERVRGVDPPAVLWELAPGRVVWATPFAAAAADNRRYVGLVLTIAELEGARPADLLAELAPPPAQPWTAEQPMRERPAVPSKTFGSLDIAFEDPSRIEAERVIDAAAVARALLAGGVARVGDPGHTELPAWVASLERWMPDAVIGRVRRGTWTAGTGAAKPDRVAELVVAAWRDRGSAAARAWRLLVELAVARWQTVDEVADELAGIADVARAALTDEERRVLPGGKHSLVDVLHAWGRGQLDQCPTAGTLIDRLADAVALGVLAELVGGGDERAVLAEARWYALLPAARRTLLFDALAIRAASLREVVHA